MEYNRFGAISNGAAKGSIAIGTKVWMTQSYFDMLRAETELDEVTSASYTPNNKNIPKYILGLDNGKQGYANPVKTYSDYVGTSVDVTGVVTSCFKLDASKAPVNYATWGGYDGKTGKLNMPNLDGKDGKVYLYGNGIFISLGATHNDGDFSHAYIKCGYADVSANLGKLAHYKDCSSGLSWFAKPSLYYGDYWIMTPTYSGDVIKFKYESPKHFNLGPDAEWNSMNLDSNAFNNVEGQTVYFTANGDETVFWTHRGGEQIFPFGESLEMTNMFVNNVYGTNVNGGNLDWSWTYNGRYYRSFK